MKQTEKDIVEKFLDYPNEKGAQPIIFHGEDAQFLSKSITGYDLLTYIKPLYQEIVKSKEQIRVLEDEFTKTNEVKSKIIVVQEISKEDAKVRIKELFDKNSDKNIYPSEVAEKLHIDYDLVLEIVEDLIKEDEIEAAR